MTGQPVGMADPGGERNLLVGVCGAAAAMVLPDYLMCLRDAEGCRIKVVMTYTATQILPADTVRLVSGDVYCEGPARFDPGHVKLAMWADQVIVLPATAHMLAQAAHGLAGNLLSSVLLAYDRPVAYFPSMNRRMWRQASVQRNVSQLRGDGHLVIEPVMKSCWEIATSTFQVGPGLPPPPAVRQLLEEFGGAPDGDMSQAGSFQRCGG